MANTTQVIKVEISTDQLLEQQRPESKWQPKGFTEGLDELSSITNQVPFIGDKVAGGVNALSKGIDTAGKGVATVAGGVAGVVIWELVKKAIQMSKQAFEYARGIEIANRQAQEVQRRAYGDERE